MLMPCDVVAPMLRLPAPAASKMVMRRFIMSGTQSESPGPSAIEMGKRSSPGPPPSRPKLCTKLPFSS